MPDTDMMTNHFTLSKEVPVVYVKETGAKTEGDYSTEAVFSLRKTDVFSEHANLF